MSDHATSEHVRGLVTLDRLAQFAAVGLAGAAVDTSLLGLFYGVFDTWLVAAKLASAELSYLFVFVLNEHWTFSEFGTRDPGAYLRRLARSNAVRLGGLATATVVLLVLTTAGVWYLVANAIGLAVGFVVNYFAESLFTWQVHR